MSASRLGIACEFAPIHVENLLGREATVEGGDTARGIRAVEDALDFLESLHPDAVSAERERFLPGKVQGDRDVKRVLRRA